MHRFFIDPTLLSNITSPTPATITLPEKTAHQVRDVLHLGVGEQLILLDNSGDEVLASVVRSGRAGVEMRLVERRKGKSESPVRIVLCQGLLKSARFEWILEKGTELGVSTFAPILCRRSMAGLEEAGPAKIQRWQRIIQEATEQCGRSRIPELLPIRPLMHALNDIPAGALALMPWEEERQLTLRGALEAFRLSASPSPSAPSAPRVPAPSSPSAPRVPARGTPTMDECAPEDDSSMVGVPLAGTLGRGAGTMGWGVGGAGSANGGNTTVVLFIGPEGGLMAEEVGLAQRYGVQAVSLGRRILRAETAALVAVANVMFALEE